MGTLSALQAEQSRAASASRVCGKCERSVHHVGLFGRDEIPLCVHTRMSRCLFISVLHLTSLKGLQSAANVWIVYVLASKCQIQSELQPIEDFFLNVFIPEHIFYLLQSDTVDCLQLNCKTENWNDILFLQLTSCPATVWPRWLLSSWRPSLFSSSCPPWLSSCSDAFTATTWRGWHPEMLNTEQLTDL